MVPKKLMPILGIFLVFVFSSNASVIAKSDICLLIACFFFLGLNLLEGNLAGFVRYLVFGLLVIGLITLVYFLKKGNIQLSTWIGFFVRCILAFSVVRLNGEHFTRRFISLTYILAAVSLVLFCLQLLSFDFLYAINNIFGIESERGLPANSNSLIFNLISIHSTRNCGFMWEPGAFGAVLIFALLLNVHANGFLTRRSIVLTLALITTFSTTAFLGLGILAVFFLFGKSKIMAALVCVGLILAMLNVDFLYNKVSGQIDDVGAELESTNYSDYNVIHLNRFSSFLVDYKVFSENWMIGLGLDAYDTNPELYKEYDKNVVRTSGIMFLLLKMGIIGFLLYFILLSKSFYKFFEERKWAVLASILVLFVLFSNPIEFSPFLLSLFFLRYV